MKKPFEFDFSVQNSSGVRQSKAIVEFERDGKKFRFSASQLSDPVQQAKLPLGKYKVTVSQAGLESQVREVEITERGLREPFILGKVGQKGYFAGKVKVPVDVPEEIVGIEYQVGAPLSEISDLEQELIS